MLFLDNPSRLREPPSLSAALQATSEKTFSQSSSPMPQRPTWLLLRCSQLPLRAFYRWAKKNDNDKQTHESKIDTFTYNLNKLNKLNLKLSAAQFFKTIERFSKHKHEQDLFLLLFLFLFLLLLMMLRYATNDL